MLIGKQFKIEADSLNITLSKRYTTKKGKEGWRPLGYYSSGKNALKALIEQEVKGTGLKDFETIVKKISELETLIDGLQGLPVIAPKNATMGKEAPVLLKEE